MTYDWTRRGLGLDPDDTDEARALSPGKQSRSAALAPRPPQPDEPVDGFGFLSSPPGAGEPLPGGLRSQWEQSLGADLSGVRVHTGAASAEAADRVHARAFATGNDIHFGAGMYNPSSPAGAHLVAHEVAHTVQQSGGPARPQAKLAVSAVGDASEREADRAADDMMAGRAARVSAAPAMIAREAKPGEPPAASPAAAGGEFVLGNFTVAGGKPAAPGSVSPVKDGGKVRLESPMISFTAEVTMVKPLTEGRIDVGPVQTLLSSSRVGVYREGGRADGPIVAEQKTELGQMRDAAGELGKDGIDQATQPPFYSAPSTLNKDSSSVSVNFKDKPKAVFPSTVGKGKLTETRGEDSFVTSITAKQDSALLHLKTFKWQLPWSMKLDDGIVQSDDKGNPTSKQIATQDARPADGIAVNDSKIPILAAAGATHMDFTSVEAAKGCSASELLRFLPTSTGASRGFIVEALKAKNPSCHVTVTVNKKNSSWGKDSVEMRFKGQNQISRPRVSAGDGEKVAVLFMLLEVFPDVGAITSGSVIRIEAQDQSLIDGKSHRVDWGWPFAVIDGKMPGTDGDYSVVAAMRG